MNQLEDLNSAFSAEDDDCPIPARRGFLHVGHPSQKYALNWKIDQAGSGWLSLGNYFGFSTVLIKKRKTSESQISPTKLQVAFHENLVGLIEAFYDSTAIYLAYNYYGVAVNLSQVSLTPAVRLSEADLSSICRSVLRGLEYIHEQLQIGHGNINGDNILLCSDGAVKIGKQWPVSLQTTN
ncbi:uncharacterized protein N7458_004339 [Penicillium daleae]|uniref:Protein kinase domain-containing protein n=1 Tax=Penicillium daleae TaxID=63821 RepID=A0AAD6CA03_9EURO|nr:uncharacterized protein N7458_004339 [Penicillium daleae]KAJ5456075.1 hypothetical protein N7458_004339 [Penicillium daleae]